MIAAAIVYMPPILAALIELSGGLLRFFPACG